MAGLVGGYVFGVQISGALMESAIAPLYAVFCSLLVGITLEEVMRGRRGPSG
ncbi:MAG: hypothetical protein LW835_12730 [Burkholderiaceae bacterium]|nr:hypothetical protein [Burkholderiaceae bacterium]